MFNDKSKFLSEGRLKVKLTKMKNNILMMQEILDTEKGDF